MSKPNDCWSVVPHGLLTRLAENIYTVNAQLRLPFGDTTRRMTIVKLMGGRLLVVGPVVLREEVMAKLEELGEPSYLVVQDDGQLPSALAWKRRYPGVTVLASSALAAKLPVELRVQDVSADIDDPRVRLLVVPGTNEAELAVIVESHDGKTLIVHELIFNLPRTRGFRGSLMQFLGYGPGAVMPKLVMMRLVQDRTAVWAQLEAWAQLSGVKRLVVSHGAPIENPRSTLLQLAAGLRGATRASDALGTTNTTLLV